MAENASHAYDLELIVGSEDLEAKTKLAISLSAGGNTSAEGEAQLTSVIGSAPGHLVPYLIFKTQSETHAAELAAFLTHEYESAKTRAQAGPGYLEDALGFAFAAAGAFGNPDLVQFEISNHGSNAIVKVKIAEEYQGTIQGGVEMALQVFGPVLDKKSHLQLSLESSGGLDAILNPATLLQNITKAFRVIFKGEVTLETSAALQNLLPLPDKTALTAFSSVFREAVVKLRFKDATQLPAWIGEKLGSIAELQAAPQLLGLLGPENKRVIKDAVLKGANSTELVVLGDHSLLKILVQFSGVENLF